MTRLKNPAFVGVSIADTDAGHASYRRAVLNAVADTALVYDMVTGENAEPNTITHEGGGRGAPLNIPWVNQVINKSISLTTPTTPGDNGGNGVTAILSYIVYVPAGATEMNILMGINLQEDWTDASWKVRLTDTGRESPPTPFSVVETKTMAEYFDSYAGHSVLSAFFDGLAPATYLVEVLLNTADVVGATNIGRLRSVIIMGRYGRTTGQSPPILDELTYGVSTPAAAEGVRFIDLPTEMFEDGQDMAIDGYTLTRLVRNQNGLREYITGYPPGGQPYTHEDQTGAGAPDATNPARSRFLAHTRSRYPDEGQVPFPVWSECLGAFKTDEKKFAVDLAEPPTVGMLDWFAPWPVDGTQRALHRVFVRFPDFLEGNTTSRLAGAVLLGTARAGAIDLTSAWEIRLHTAALGASFVSPLPADGTTSSTLWIARFSAVLFNPDANQKIEIEIRRTGAKTTVDEICVIAGAMWFEP